MTIPWFENSVKDNILDIAESELNFTGPFTFQIVDVKEDKDQGWTYVDAVVVLYCDNRALTFEAHCCGGLEMLGVDSDGDEIYEMAEVSIDCFLRGETVYDGHA